MKIYDDKDKMTWIVQGEDSFMDKEPGMVYARIPYLPLTNDEVLNTKRKAFALGIAEHVVDKMGLLRDTNYPYNH